MPTPTPPTTRPWGARRYVSKIPRILTPNRGGERWKTVSRATHDVNASKSGAAVRDEVQTSAESKDKCCSHDLFGKASVSQLYVGKNEMAIDGGVR